MHIMIKDYAQNDAATSYAKGKECFDSMATALDNGEDVTLNFKDVNFVIMAFLNPVIGDTIFKYGSDIMQKIKINFANESILSKIKIVKDGAMTKIIK